MSHLIHWNPHQHPPAQLLFLRSLLSALCLLPFCWRQMAAYGKKGSFTLWSRAVAGTGSVLFYYETLQGTSAANANLMFAGAPVFVGLISFFLLRERIPMRETVGISLIVLGNILLYIPNRSSIPPWVWIYGSLGAFCASLAFLSLGEAAKRHGPFMIVLGFSVVSGIAAALVPSSPWLPYASEQIIFLLAVSLLGLASQLLATLSFARLSSSLASALGRTSILFSALLGVLLLNLWPHPLEWLSYLIVVFGVGVAGGLWFHKRPKQGDAR
jgi:drug/metabolite transporter (DMT)-like permease